MPYAPDLAGSALDGRYELHALIGEGTFGRVYRGRDRRLEREVAIKVIKPWWADDPDWARRFARETQLLAKVSDIGIVQIYDVGHAEEGLYYVAELVEGESLASRLRRGPLPPSDACEVGEQLCRALAHAHQRGIVHRDIKPANILIGESGEVKVGDFGGARLTEGTSEGPATVIGTPRYMSPEQARGLPTGPATDVYSAGVVLYEMLAGTPPFPGSSAVELALRHLQDPPPPLPRGTPRGLAKIVDRALAKRPEDRYASSSEMADALAVARAGLRRTSSTPTNGAGHAGAGAVDRTRVAPQFSPRRNVNPSARRQTVVVLAVAFVVLVALSVAAVIIGSPQYTLVPKLARMSRAAILTKAGRDHLKVQFARRYDGARPGTAIAQDPPSGARVVDGSVVNVVLSKGPPPVPLPPLDGVQATNAKVILAKLGLSVRVIFLPAPGTAAGVVLSESPRAGQSVPARSTVSLTAAETPSWRTVTAFSGDGAGRSVAFRIRGPQWRILYSMNYQGTCNWIFFCSGPSARVTRVGDPWSGPSFGLGSGDGQTRVFQSGPGDYQVAVSPGSDSADWSIQVQDYY